MGWLIFAAIVLLIFGFFCLRFRLCLVYDEDLTLKVKVLFFSYQVFPEKEKKPKAKNFSIKKLHKKKKSSKVRHRNQDTTEQPKKKQKSFSDLLEMLVILRDLLEVIAKHSKKHLRVELTRIYIRVSGGDAANTAILYAVVTQSTAYIIELLSHFTDLKVKKHNSIAVEPDFINRGNEAKIRIVLSMRLWQILSLLLSSLIHLNKLKLINLPKGQESTNG